MGTTQERYDSVVRTLVEQHRDLTKYINATDAERNGLAGQHVPDGNLLSRLGLTNGTRAESVRVFNDEALKRVAREYEGILKKAGVEVTDRKYVLDGQPIELEGEQE